MSYMISEGKVAMRKITDITVWFTGYLTCASILVIALILITPAKMYPHLFEHGALEGLMADFSRRSFKYHISRHDNSIVIVGPSYAAEVGEADGIYNLGIALANMPQITKQVTKVKAADTPVYFLGIRDFIQRPMSQDHPFNRTTIWFPCIIKGIDFSLSGVRPKSIWATREAQDAIDAHLIRLYKTLGLNDPTKINLEPLYEMREINGNIIFALSPIRLDDDCVADTHRALETALSQSDLRFMNLSRILDDDAFGDRYHFTQESQEAIVAALRLEIPL